MMEQYMIFSRRVSVRAVTVAFAVAAWSFTVSHAQVPPRGSGWMPVTGPVRVIEADTLEIEVDGRRLGVAVAGIVAPAGNTECGREAIAVAQVLVADGIELQEDLGLPSVDKRLRRVYRVALPSGRSLAEELVLAGYVRPDPHATAALERLSIVGAAAEARAYDRGCVWRINSPG
jgi:endonuclease YncB( thermonuclease family)